MSSELTRGPNLCPPVADKQTDRAAHYMAQALSIAGRALGRTAPNPAVGAVVVNNGVVVGQGYTHPPGGPHAEVAALRDAGELARGGDLYVTLEPCCHFGKTPPCTDAIISAGIRRVYAAVIDPFPEVNGRGIEYLRKAGITVHVGPCEENARKLNEGFFKRMATGLPFVTAKYAMTLDGRIATRTGQSRWITGKEARLEVHRLRDRVDAILVGAGTVAVDDPQLTTRLPIEAAGTGGPHHPLRIILAGTSPIPEGAKLMASHLPGRTLIACTPATAREYLAIWERRNLETLIVGGPGTRVCLPSLLAALGARGLNTLLVEGGAEVLHSFFADRLVDRLQVYIAPKLVGGRMAPGPLGGIGCESMEQAWKLRDVTVEELDGDLFVDGYVDQGRSSGWSKDV